MGEDIYFTTLIAENEQQAREMAVAEVNQKYLKNGGRPREWSVRVWKSDVEVPPASSIAATARRESPAADAGQPILPRFRQRHVCLFRGDAESLADALGGLETVAGQHDHRRLVRVDRAVAQQPGQCRAGGGRGRLDK